MLSAFLLSHFAFGATFKESADIVTKTYKVQLETSPFYTRDAAFKKIVDDAKDVCPFPNDYDKLNRCTELVIAGLERLKTVKVKQYSVEIQP